jgi:hypothetical protein
VPPAGSKQDPCHKPALGSVRLVNVAVSLTLVPLPLVLQALEITLDIALFEVGLPALVRLTLEVAPYQIGFAALTLVGCKFSLAFLLSLLAVFDIAAIFILEAENDGIDFRNIVEHFERYFKRFVLSEHWRAQSGTDQHGNQPCSDFHNHPPCNANSLANHARSAARGLAPYDPATMNILKTLLSAPCPSRAMS